MKNMKPEEFDAGTYTLQEMKELIAEVEKEYGQQAQFNFDAGYNNISLKILFPGQLSRYG